MTAPKITAAAVAAIVLTAALIAVIIATATPASGHCPDGTAGAYRDTEHHYTGPDGEPRTHPATIHTCTPE